MEIEQIKSGIGVSKSVFRQDIIDLSEKLVTTAMQEPDGDFIVSKEMMDSLNLAISTYILYQKKLEIIHQKRRSNQLAGITSRRKK